MNITVNSSVSGSAFQGQRPPKAGGPIEDAAKALGLSTSDVTSALRSGKSLGDIADEKGVSRDTLATALKEGMPSDLKASVDADEVANKIIDQVGMPSGGPQGMGGPQGKGGPQGPPPPPPSGSSTSGVYGDSLTDDQQSTLDKLADLLGTDSTGLLDDLKSGKSLSTMLTDKGVTQDKLAGVLQNSLLIDTRA